MADPIALVLAGGGARGAYEIGALSVMLPALPVDERPNLILGTSVGALNGAYLAATLPDGVEAALEAGRAIWEASAGATCSRRRPSATSSGSCAAR